MHCLSYIKCGLCSNAFWEHRSLCLSCITFEHSLTVLTDNWHDLQHGSLLCYSKQQRSYLGTSQFPSPNWTVSKPTFFDLIRPSHSGLGAGWRNSHEAVWVLWYCFVKSIMSLFCSLHCLKMTSTAWTATVTPLTFIFIYY